MSFPIQEANDSGREIAHLEASVIATRDEIVTRLRELGGEINYLSFNRKGIDYVTLSESSAAGIISTLNLHANGQFSHLIDEGNKDEQLLEEPVDSLDGTLYHYALVVEHEALQQQAFDRHPELEEVLGDGALASYEQDEEMSQRIQLLFQEYIHTPTNRIRLLNRLNIVMLASLANLEDPSST